MDATKSDKPDDSDASETQPKPELDTNKEVTFN